MQDRSTKPLTHAAAARLAYRYVGAYNERDLDAMLVVNEDRVLGPDRCAILGEIHDRGELVSPWGVVVRVRDGLIVESRSYLGDTALLESLRVLGEPSTAS